jgi:uncharacterized membrane protein
MHKFWIFLHLVGVITWIGGMFFMLHVLRPSLETLAGPERGKFMLTIQGRFFKMVTVALVLIWGSGLAMLGTAISNGLKPWPIGWHLMMTLAAVMTLVFLFIRFALFPAAQKALAAGRMEEFVPVMEQIRMSVVTNMGLGFVTVAAAIFGR